MSSVRSVLAAVIALAGAEAGCGGDYPIPVHPVAGIGGILGPLQPKTPCLVQHINTAATTTYAGPDGQAIPLTPAECQQANAQSLATEQQAAQQRAAQDAQAEQQRSAAAAAQAARDEEARGYKHITMNDLLLDGRAYAGNETKIAVKGFYKLQGRRDERFYISYNDFMMHTYSSVAANYVGLLTENGSRPLREYLLRCGNSIGCEVTILGHVSPCVETNVFGATTGDFCLVAEDVSRTN